MSQKQKAIALNRIGILEPQFPNRTTGIINGKTSGILNWNDIPYPSFYRAYKELSTNYWLPDEVDMRADLAHYQQLTRDEQRALHSSILLLASLEAPHNHFIYTVAEYITEPAVHANAAIIGQQEMIHSEGYHYLLHALTGQADPEAQLAASVDLGLIEQQQQPMHSRFQAFIEAKTAITLAYALVQSAILEGLSFYPSFAFLFSKARRKRLLNSSKILQLIQRDGQAHSRFISDIFRALVDETPSLKAEMVSAVPAMLAETIALQEQWSAQIFATYEELPLSELKTYLQNRANYVASLLAMETPYPYADEQALSWMDDFTSTASLPANMAENSARKTFADNGFNDI